MSLQRMKAHRDHGEAKKRLQDSGLGGRNLTARKFMAMLSAFAVVVSGLIVGVAAPAQAATAISPPETLLVTSNQFVLTLTPATGETWAGAETVKTNTTFDINNDALQLGTWTRTGNTVITISGVSGLSGATTATVLDAAATGGNLSTSTITLSQAKVDVTSAAFTMFAADNAATITLTGGTFKAGDIDADDFTFGGADAAALRLGTFTRTSDTVVTITGLSNLTGANNNTVLVLATTMANGAASVTGTSLIAPITSPAFTMNTADTQATITLTDGTFKTGTIVAADFTFGGTDAAALAAGASLVPVTRL